MRGPENVHFTRLSSRQVFTTPFIPRSPKETPYPTEMNSSTEMKLTDQASKHSSVCRTYTYLRGQVSDRVGDEHREHAGTRAVLVAADERVGAGRSGHSRRRCFLHRGGAGAVSIRVNGDCAAATTLLTRVSSAVVVAHTRTGIQLIAIHAAEALQDTRYIVKQATGVRILKAKMNIEVDYLKYVLFCNRCHNPSGQG